MPGSQFIDTAPTATAIVGEEELAARLLALDDLAQARQVLAEAARAWLLADRCELVCGLPDARPVHSDPQLTASIEAALAATANRGGTAGDWQSRALDVPRREGWAVLAWSAPSAPSAVPDAGRQARLFAAASAWVRRYLRVATLERSLDRLEKAERLQRALYAIADLASSELDMPEMLRGLHGIVAALMYAENFFIVRYDAGSAELRYLYFVDRLDPDPPVAGDVFPPAAAKGSLTMAVIRERRSLLGPSARLREELGLVDHAQLGPDAEHWLGVPMVSGGEVRGAIVVQSYEARHRYSEDDRILLSFVAQHILTALERKSAQEALERRVEERTGQLAKAIDDLRFEVEERQRGERLQSELFRIARVASATVSLDEFYAEIHAIVGELLDARNFYIALLSDDGEALEFPYSVDERDPRRPRRRLAKGLTEYVLRSGRPLLADRAAIEALTRSGEVQSFGPRSTCWLGVPLSCEERIVGVLAVQSYTEDRVFTPRDQELLTFVGYHIAECLLRKRAQESLKAAYLELERRVAERTQELARANRELRAQIGERERAESRLKHQTLHDGLTGLPNRSMLLERLTHALAAYQRDRTRRFAVLFLDLDRFKIVNDSVGHLVGDELLKEAGRRLAAVLRAPDLVARLGGDEFAILLEDIQTEQDAFAVAHRAIEALGTPMRIGGKELYTSASIGIALSHPRYQRAVELLRDADVAMYRAKAKGRRRWELFDEALHTEALRLLDLEGDMRRAIVRSEFEPHFQSIVDLVDGRVLGFEALLRWQHAERGLLLPADFLAVAEDNGLIEQIDWQMFDRICREIPALARNGTYVCINVSNRHFRSPDLHEAILALLRMRGVAPERVRLEVTEGTLLENPDQIRRTLERLREAGILAQLDDFGTGYSSLSYLHRFPIHALKIDRSFVSELEPGGQGGSAAVVRAIQALAHSMGLEVVAEGIETAAQRRALLELGCRCGQGYLFSHPQPARAWLGDA